MELDQRFLTVHPATALWWKQREQCRVCKHAEVEKDTHRGITTMRWQCKATKLDKPIAIKLGIFAACIDARLPGMACGPKAKLFEPAIAISATL